MLIIRFNHGSPYMFLSFSAKSVCSYPQGFDNKNITVKTKKAAATRLICFYVLVVKQPLRMCLPKKLASFPNGAHTKTRDSRCLTFNNKTKFEFGF
ncbi:hypothetical protein J31TS3_35340 [Paenibacillus lactis]|nr:hypothetical protein J31TS3_35340 [Paenibacillus lactis]